MGVKGVGGVSQGFTIPTRLLGSQATQSDEGSKRNEEKNLGFQRGQKRGAGKQQCTEKIGQSCQEAHFSLGNTGPNFFTGQAALAANRDSRAGGPSQAAGSYARPRLEPG